MKDEQIKEKRRKAFLDAIKYLNDRSVYYSRLFNCGELGYLLVEWRTRWTARWFDEAISFGDETGVLEDEVRDCLEFTNEGKKERAE